MGFVIWIVVVVALVAAIVAMIRAPKTGSGAASLTAMHDLQPRDKQQATETIMELKAERRRGSESSGERPEEHGA